jgi:protease IV
MGFFKTMFASAIGFFIAFLIISVVFFFIIVGILASSGEPEPYVRANSILKIELTGSIPERSSVNPFDELFPQGRDEVSLASLRSNLEKAAADERVDGIWLEIDFISTSWPILEELRELLVSFRESGKFLYASTKDMGMNEQALFLATAADSVFAMKDTFIQNSGFYMQGMFFSEMFEKFGIEADVIPAGEFKTAAESYERSSFSEANEEQLSAILMETSRTYTAALSEHSGKSTGEVNAIMNLPPNLTSQYSVANGFIDALMYPHEVEDHIKRRMGVEDDDDLEIIKNQRYNRVSRRSAGLERRSPGDKIAIIYATGPIVPIDETLIPGTGDPVITATAFIRSLDDALDDDDVKGIVVRINSPGGSASTSDLIWDAIKRASGKKPVIASMGSVAASGGYYIAMAADTIVASPTTITGSIGVIAAKLNFGNMLDEQLGITFDEIKSHEHADWFSPTRGLSPEELESLQAYTSDFYEVFISKVAESRGMDPAEVRPVAEGRVWTGSDAKDLGLIDVLGGFGTALDIAAAKAGLDEYSLEVFPKPKSLFEVLSGSADTQVRLWVRSLSPFPLQTIADHTAYLKYYRTLEVMAIMPQQIEVR